MKRLIWTFLLLGVVFPTPRAGAAERPNIVLVLADDMTYHDSGAYGSDMVKTPNIDRLAREGMLFQRMFTSTAMCSPTRQQLYTGVWPVRNGAYPNHSGVYEGAKSWVHHFRDLGYRCGLAGKNHCKPAEAFPWERVGGGREWGMEEIRKFLVRDPAQPFFLVASNHDPHAPWDHGDASLYPPDQIQVPPYMVDTPRTREALSRYYAEITYMDAQMGRVLALLEETGQAENTIVIFTSEQGSAFPFGKWTLYEAGLQTAFVVRWPGRVQAGSTTPAISQYVDVLPTLIAAAGADPRALDTGVPGAPDGGRGFDGISLLPVLLGESAGLREYAYGVHTTRGIMKGTDYPVRSVRGKRFKYIHNLNHTATFTNVVTEPGSSGGEESIFASWRAAGKEQAARASFYQHRPEHELYDLETDPHELHNLAGQTQFTAVEQKLRRALGRWMKQQGDQGMATELRADQRQGK